MDKRESEKGGNEWDEDEVIVMVDGKILPLGNFPKKIIKEVIVAMVNSLKSGEGKEIEIKIKK